MTKTLTEQWHEGKLPENTYYVKFICGRYGIYEFEQFKGFGFGNDLAYIKEVLAPVPSYTELTLMTGNYRLATKALRDCYNEMKYWATMNHRCEKIFDNIKGALVEIEEEEWKRH